MESNKDDTQEKYSQGGGISIKRFFEYFKIISLVALVFSVIAMFIFSITYANEYKVPLSMYFSNFWLFGYMFVSLIYFGLISLCFSVIIYRVRVENIKRTYIEIPVILIIYIYFQDSLIIPTTLLSTYIFITERKWHYAFSIIIVSILSSDFVITIFNLDSSNPEYNYYLFRGFIVASLSFAFYILIKFFYKRDNSTSLLYSSIIYIFFMILGASAYKDCFTEGFKQLLIKNNIATKEIKIYIKDENRIINGKIIFQNSTHALVESKCDLKNCAIKECDSKVARDWFLIENIIILQDSFSGENSAKKETK